MVDKIAGLSALAVAKAKDCINRAYEVPLSEGLRYEQCVPSSSDLAYACFICPSACFLRFLFRVFS
jgi:hypothetical protein